MVAFAEVVFLAQIKLHIVMAIFMHTGRYICFSENTNFFMYLSK